MGNLLCQDLARSYKMLSISRPIRLVVAHNVRLIGSVPEKNPDNIAKVSIIY